MKRKLVEGYVEEIERHLKTARTAQAEILLKHSRLLLKDLLEEKRYDHKRHLRRINNIKKSYEGYFTKVQRSKENREKNKTRYRKKKPKSKKVMLDYSYYHATKMRKIYQLYKKGQLSKNSEKIIESKIKKVDLVRTRE